MEEEEVLDSIDAWHESDSTLPLWDYLGWTRDEYAAWVGHPSAVGATMGKVIDFPLIIGCDKTMSNATSPVPHDYESAGEEYGSLGDGGSYWRLRCKQCGRIAYSPMPD